MVKKFRETGQTSNRPGQGRKRTVRTKRIVKTREKSWGQIPVVRRPNWPQRLESARLRCAASLRRTSRPSPTRCRTPWAHTHTRTNEGRKMSTPSEPHGRWHAAQFGVSDEKKFDVEQCVNYQNNNVWGRNASVEGRRVSRRQNPAPVVVWVAVIDNWTVSGISRTF